MKHVILGTAGHIDHGKTTLVKALTGTDTDRLPEEKARGITIDLGFAHLQLEDLKVGVVDVPGHEALIRNMLAGATGFDGVLLVVAADESIMPQTREHFAIAELLGIERLIVAITKCDLVDADWLELVQTEVAEWLRYTPFAEAPVVATSAADESGIAELREVLHSELSKAAERRSTDLFRMPVDRVFTVRGTGTVVTGTVWSGSAATDDAARLLPGERTVRIRGCQTHGSAVDHADAGERAAFAIAGAERSDVARGDVLVLEDVWRAVDSLTARVRTLADVVLKHRQRVRVHLGTAEVMARVVLLEPDWLQLRLEAPLVARAGDRFVLRSYSPVATIGGGIVADVARLRKRLTPEESRWLGQIIDGNDNQRVAAAVFLEGQRGHAINKLPLATGLTPAQVADALAQLSDDVAIINDVGYARAILDAEAARAVALVRQFHKTNPLKPGMELSALLAHTGMGRDLAQAAIANAETDGALTRRGNLMVAADFAPSFTPAQQALRDKLLQVLQEAGLAPPSVPELAQQLKSNDVRAVLRLLEQEGKVTAIAPDLFLDAPTLDQALHLVRANLAGRALPATAFRVALPVSRKFLIPLLEYMDRYGITRRDGDLRWVV